MTAPVAAPAAPTGFNLLKTLKSPEVPYLALGLLAVFVLLSAVVLQFRRGSE